jgi:hypothetical protein
MDIGQAKWADTQARKKAKVADEEVQEREREAHSKLTEKVREEAHKVEVFDSMLANLQVWGYSLADILEYIFNPANLHGFDWCWQGFFAHRGIIERILGYWMTARYNMTTHRFINSWAIKHVQKVTAWESAQITESGILWKTANDINEGFFLTYSLSNLTKRLPPHTFAVLDAISTTPRQLQKLSDEWFRKKDLVSDNYIRWPIDKLMEC